MVDEPHHVAGAVVGLASPCGDGIFEVVGVDGVEEPRIVGDDLIDRILVVEPQQRDERPQLQGETRTWLRSAGGTTPDTDLYHSLQPRPINHGDINIPGLLATRPQTTTHNPNGHYTLYRIGDAVAGRNIHTAIPDAYRLCSAI